MDLEDFLKKHDAENPALAPAPKVIVATPADLPDAPIGPPTVRQNILSPTPSNIRGMLVVGETVRLENTRQNHNKFWSVRVYESNDVWIERRRWGRAGSTGQTKDFIHRIHSDAVNSAINTAEEKLNKGYVMSGWGK